MDTAVGQVFNTNTFHEDVLRLNSYYDKIGYSGQVPSHVTGLNITPQGVLSISILEGLTVRGIEIEGVPLLKEELIRNALALKVGQPYSDELQQKDFENLKALYEKYDLELGDFDEGIDPTTIDTKNGTAVVKVDVHVMTVGAVEITGNTKTKDIVARRQLTLRPGDILTQAGLKRDDERLNNLGFFEKVDLVSKPGPDPKKPWAVTLDWNVKEQRTGTAQIGAGYSGGPTGEGLTGVVSYSQNNINGTGNAASIRLETGARISDGSISFTIPYLGNTPKSEKYSLAGSVFTSAQTNFLAVYGASTASTVQPNPIVSTPSPSGGGSSSTALGGIPVVLTPTNDLLPVAALYGTRSNGLAFTLGRRLSYTLTSSVGITAERLSTDVTLPGGYFLAGSQTILNNPLTSTLFGAPTNGTTLGIIAPSIANTSNGQGYNLRSLTLGLQSDTRDDIFNPRHGSLVSLSEELSGKVAGSQFGYTITTLDAAKFYPVMRDSTLGFHALLGDTTGAIPPNKLFVLTDQQLRGYSQVFYGTEEVLLQSELRYPLTPDRKLSLVLFYDYGGQRIRGAEPILDQFGNVAVDYNKFLYRSDGGIGVTFDLPQLGFRS
ncbi:MAG: BamA/OMP85 family outer membrane protein, partial [Acidimicrobiales bacterium]